MTDHTFERYEKKYLLSERQYDCLRSKAAPFMCPDCYGRHTVCSIYYDTPDNELIRASIEKPKYKEKLRLRSYGIPKKEDDVFLEIKKKYDGIVYKRREELPYSEAVRFAAGEKIGRDSQIFRELEYFIGMHKPVPKLYIAYDRVALCGINQPELRITFDENIRSRTDRLDLTLGDDGELLLEKGTYLMELKVHGAIPQELAVILSELKAYPVSFSKYGSIYSKSVLEKSAAKNIEFITANEIKNAI